MQKELVKRLLAFRNRPASVNSAVVALDPGHGGNDPGAIASGILRYIENNTA